MKKNKYEGASMGQLKLELAITIIMAVLLMVALVFCFKFLHQQERFLKNDVTPSPYHYSAVIDEQRN